MEIKCYECGYEWDSRVAKPKACPRCKTRLDYMWGELKSKRAI